MAATRGLVCGAALTRVGLALRHLIRGLAALGLFLVFVNAFAIVIDALMRSWFAAPIDRLDDVSRAIFVVGAACCIPAATALRGHITIRVFEHSVSARTSAFLEMVADGIAMLVFGLMAWQLGNYTLEVAEFRQTFAQIDLPIWPLWAFATAMLGLTVLVQWVHWLDACLTVAQPRRRSALTSADDLGESSF